jgi:hypothetical protein
VASKRIRPLQKAPLPHQQQPILQDSRSPSNNRAQPQRRNQSRTRRCWSPFVQILNPDDALQPGVYCIVELNIPVKTPSLIVPADATIFNQNGLQVAVVEDGTVHIRKVSVTRDLGTQVEVDDGVKQGDRVVVNPPVTLSRAARYAPAPRSPYRAHLPLPVHASAVDMVATSPLFQVLVRCWSGSHQLGPAGRGSAYTESHPKCATETPMNPRPQTGEFRHTGRATIP